MRRIIRVGDCNVEGEAAIPVLGSIKDVQHRVHRSYETASGERVMDSRPYRTLRAGDLHDVARHAALLPAGPGLAAVAPTVDAWDTHGPAHRVDVILTSAWLLPAVLDVEVIDMKGLSDHHTVVTTYDLDTLTDLCLTRYAPA